MKNLQKIVSSPFCYKFNDSDICLLSIPYDSGDLERVGCRLGPDEVKKSLWLLYGYDAQTKKSMFDKKVCDLGDVRVCTGYFEETRRRVKGVVKKLKDKIPILLLGEHTMTAVALEEVNARHVVVFDAHLDMWDKYDNFKWSPACTVRRIIDLGKKVTMVGTRDVSEEELTAAEKLGVKMETIDRLKPDKPFYLSIDMDAFDASVAPAAVCPRYGGLKYMAVSEFIKKNANLIEGMDFSGICPLYDNGNTSMLAAQLIVDFLTHLK